jgi:hypothetical protein
LLENIEVNLIMYWFYPRILAPSYPVYPVWPTYYYWTW